jgi:non-ribosomal peptide synthetase component E (peptide arylation enzyme)
MGEIGVAVVVPRDPEDAPTLTVLREYATGKLAAYKLPEAVHVVDALPLTAMEKIDRRALVALVASPVAAPAERR